jgi:hypothetical protein
MVNQCHAKDLTSALPGRFSGSFGFGNAENAEVGADPNRTRLKVAEGLEANTRPRLSFREHLASFREHLASFREHVAKEVKVAEAKEGNRVAKGKVAKSGAEVTFVNGKAFCRWWRIRKHSTSRLT